MPTRNQIIIGVLTIGVPLVAISILSQKSNPQVSRSINTLMGAAALFFTLTKDNPSTEEAVNQLRSIP